MELYTEHLHIRSIEPSDKEQFLGLQREVGEITNACEKLPGYAEQFWNDTLNDEGTINLAVLDREEGRFIASCCIQHIHRPVIELGIDVTSSRRDQGVGTEILKALIRVCRERFPGRKAVARTRVDNAPSRRMIEKCGGVFSGSEDTPEAKLFRTLLDDVKEKSGEEHERIDDANPNLLTEAESEISGGEKGVLVYVV